MRRFHLLSLLCGLSVGFGASSIALGSVPDAVGQGVLRVVDNQEGPVVGAGVLIGHAENDPFPNNIFQTNEEGVVEKPMEWNTRQPVTIDSANHILTTYMDTDPDRQVLRVKNRLIEEFIPVRGDISGYGHIRNGDDKIDFSLILPALTRRQLMDFDSFSILSPEGDTLKLPFGKTMDIPSNISLPKQKESYGTFPSITIRFDKPSYRVFTREYGHKRIVAIRGHFPFKQVVNGFPNGQSVVELVKHFKFFGGGQLDVDVQGAVSGQDIRVDEWRLDDKFSVRAPQYGGQRVMLSISLIENAYKELFPVDIKMIESNKLGTVKSRQSQTGRYVLSALVNQTSSGGKSKLDFNQVSLAINEVRTEVTPVFLDMIEAPIVEGTLLTLKSPQMAEGVFPVATYLAFSKMEPLPKSALKGGAKKTRVWEVFNHSWVSQVELPEVSLNLGPGQKHERYVWEVIYLGSERQIAEGEDWTFEDISHATRNVLEI